MPLVLTDKQKEALEVLGGPAAHCMLYGGARSGKTFLIMLSIIARAVAVEKSRHAVLRFRFNHVVTSIVLDTLPKCMQLAYPELIQSSKLDKSLWMYKFWNGSEIWFGGLDEKERTEKILGQEYATLFLNECSQIPFGSRTIALTRLAQNTELRLKAFYDCNPPGKSHWTHKLFIDKKDPDRNSLLKDRADYVALRLNPDDNRANLPEAYFKTLESLPERQRRRFYLGEFASETDSALWTPELLDNRRVIDGELPDMQRIVIAVDPSGCSGPEDERSDEVGIVVVGLGRDQRGYVLEDLSGKHGPREWGGIVAGAYDRWSADCVVGESNFGGAMVQEVIRSSHRQDGLPLVYREVKATRGKAVRAEPVSYLWQYGKASMVGYHHILEDQLCGMTPAGYIGDRSPDRADAMVWGLTAIFPSVVAEKRHGGGNVAVESGMNWNPNLNTYQPYSGY